MNADGSAESRLTNHVEWDRSPSWSPDGNRVAFISNRDWYHEIYAVNLNSYDLTQLTFQLGTLSTGKLVAGWETHNVRLRPRRKR